MTKTRYENLFSYLWQPSEGNFEDTLAKVHDRSLAVCLGSTVVCPAQEGWQPLWPLGFNQIATINYANTNPSRWRRRRPMRCFHHALHGRRKPGTKVFPACRIKSAAFNRACINFSCLLYCICQVKERYLLRWKQLKPVARWIEAKEKGFQTRLKASQGIIASGRDGFPFSPFKIATSWRPDAIVHLRGFFIF